MYIYVTNLMPSPLAQLVERETVKFSDLEAVGSTPTWRDFDLRLSRRFVMWKIIRS